MPKVHEGKLDAANRRFAIVVARFNSLITGKLLDGALDCLRRHGCPEDHVEVAWVPGSFELPLVAKKLAATGRFDAVLCLGAIIRSDTPHFDFIATETARGIARVGQVQLLQLFMTLAASALLLGEDIDRVTLIFAVAVVAVVAVGRRMPVARRGL